jgi:hypothetical protein
MIGSNRNRPVLTLLLAQNTRRTDAEELKAQSIL